MAPHVVRTLNVVVESVKVEAAALLPAAPVMRRRTVAGILLKAAAPTAHVRSGRDRRAGRDETGNSYVIAIALDF
jgi:hypothetical protein